MEKKVTYLVTGIIVTVLYWIFKVEILEKLYYAQGFSDEMYNNSIYGIVTAISIGMAWLVAAIYYYVINSVRFARWWHWLSMLVIVTLITPIICYFVTTGIFNSAGKDYAHEAMAFSVSNLLTVAVLFVIASFSIRWWSSNCRHTPSPQ